MRALVCITACVIVFDVAAPASAQSRSSPHVTVTALQPPPPRARGHEVDVPLAVIGASIFFVGWLGGAATNLYLSVLTYIDPSGPGLPCVPSFCGDSILTVSFIPVVGSAIWSVLVIEEPPRAGAGITTTGFLATIAQQAGLALLVTGLVGRVPPILPEGFVSSDGASFGVRGSF